MAAVADEVTRRLLRAFPEIEKVLLFGSRARGDARPDSDWDFLVIMPSSLPPGRRTLAVRRAARLRGVPMDFLVRTPEEVRRGFPLAKEIFREGRVLYDRGR